MPTPGRIVIVIETLSELSLAPVLLLSNLSLALYLTVVVLLPFPVSALRAIRVPIAVRLPIFLALSLATFVIPLTLSPVLSIALLFTFFLTFTLFLALPPFFALFLLAPFPPLVLLPLHSRGVLVVFAAAVHAAPGVRCCVWCGCVSVAHTTVRTSCARRLAGLASG